MKERHTKILPKIINPKNTKVRTYSICNNKRSFNEKKACVFLLFIFYLDAPQKLLRIPLTCAISRLSALQNKIKSFAKNRCETFGPILKKENGVHSCLSTALSIRFPNLSTYSMNKWREKGSPYLKPREGENCFNISPFQSICIDEEEHNSWSLG